MPQLSASSILEILGLALLAGVGTLVGVALAFVAGRNVGAIAVGIGFSAAIMVLISLLELIPESLRLGSSRSVATGLAIGAGLMAALHFAIPHTHLVEEHGGLSLRLTRSAYLVAIGLVLHDFPEGFALANSYLAVPRLGIFLAVAIGLHNIPEGFAMSAPALGAGRRRFLLAAAIASVLAEPAGALVGIAAFETSPDLIGAFIAFAAGAMLFVSLNELIPLAREYGRPRQFIVGATAGLAIYLLLRWLLSAG